MTNSASSAITRRALLRAWLTLPAAALLVACGSGAASATPTRTVAGTAETSPPQPATATQQPRASATAAGTGQSAAATPAGTAIAQPATTRVAATNLAPTPACDDDDDEPTPAQTEGPYFTPNSPERTSLLEPGLPGTELVVTGMVLTTDCQPVAGALLDFWQADDAGAYDNAGYRLRGHQFTDAQGRYRLTTIVPGLYPGRTRHIHAKVQAPSQPVLTTQLYFPGEPRNAADRIFNQALLMTLADASDTAQASYDFVLALR